MEGLHDMLKGKDLENLIIKKLSLYHAIGEIKLLDMISNDDDPYRITDYNTALVSLFRKGIIDMVADKTNTMNIYRLRYDYH